MHVQRLPPPTTHLQHSIPRGTRTTLLQTPFCISLKFSRPITKIANQQGFALSGFSPSARISSQTAKVIHNNGADEVLAGYAPGTDVRGFTAATVAPGAVQVQSGRAGLPGTVALGGSNNKGTLDLPTLKSAHGNATLNQVTYHFSQNIKNSQSKQGQSKQGQSSKGGLNAKDFGFYTKSGHAVRGSQIVTSDLHDVTVQFPRQVRNAARYFANADAVTSARGLQNVPTATGHATAAPSLADVSDLQGATQFTYTFNQPVSSVTAKDFLVYTAGGKELHGMSYVKPSSTTVKVAFPQIQRYGHAVTAAAVNQGAVKASNSSQAANTVGLDRVGTSSSNSPAKATSITKIGGITSGPDLKSVAVDKNTGQVHYTFDKAVDNAKTYQPQHFQLVTDAGDVVAASGVVGVNGKTVTVDFNPTVAASAHDAAVSANAVQSFIEVGNPVGIAPAGAAHAK
jgi:hypothetical protein